MAEEKLINVFLTGLLTDNELIETLTGKPLKYNEDVVLEGFDLVIQRLNDIPESARDLLKKTWGDNFESYNLLPGERSIRGIKCQITQDQWNRLDDWELGEFGWFVPQEVEIKNLGSGQVEKVMTLVMGQGQTYDRKVDGINPPQFLMPRERTLQVASEVKKSYDARLGNIEGQRSILERGN